MCYDISFTVNLRQLSDYFPGLVYDDQLSLDLTLGAHIIGHAYGEHPVIYKNRDDEKLHVKMMEWGCIPFYVKDLSTFTRQRATMLNARSERILDDPKSYWNKIRNRRCLVPITGFYEHRRVTKFKNKIPYLVQLKDQPMFFLPGLYSVAEVVDKATGEMQKVWTYTILTRGANSLMKQIHNDGDNQWRMPLMLPFELSKKWVENELSDEEYREILAYEMPAAALGYKTVWTIRSPKLRPDGKEKNEEFVWEGLEELAVE
jgi:putative SOS response-associated peptidase YedK